MICYGNIYASSAHISTCRHKLPPVQPPNRPTTCSNLAARLPQIEKYRKASQDAATAATANESRLKEVSKEGSKAERERKAAEQEAKARDVRLARALEEVEKYKAMLGQVKAQVGFNSIFNLNLISIRKVEKYKAMLSQGAGGFILVSHSYTVA